MTTIVDGSQNADPYFSSVPFAKRWDCHKATIIRFHLDDGNTVEVTAEHMKTNYKFDARQDPNLSVRQYKYHLSKWGISKNISSLKKEQAIKAIGKRTRDGTEVGGVRYNGREVPKKRLRRYMGTQAKLEQDLQLRSNVFTYWNLPYKAYNTSSALDTNASSPFGVSASTPSDLSVLSPRNDMASRPSPRNAPTPTTVAIRDKSYSDRTKFLIQGMNIDFMKDMPIHERKHWSPGLLGFSEFQDASTSPNTPAASVGIPCDSGFKQDPNEPLSLCRWSIHLGDHNIHYEESLESLEDGQEDLDLGDPDSWSPWLGNAASQDLVEHLQEALQSNSFSNIDVKDLPFSAGQLIKAARRSPAELLEEAISFAIMARNADLLSGIIMESRQLLKDLNLARIHPFHLATSYLDGAGACCNVLDVIIHNFTGRHLIKNLYVNDLGYTVLDNLFINILKAHTNCTPGTIDDSQRKVKRFPGEEVDVCGRWDADSHCVRSLLSGGQPVIPISWKHMFCHTSTQAICHSIVTIFSPFFALDINTPSGLFTKRCRNCSQKLTLLPLHSLVLVAFYLARSGCEGENLFGILACLVCLLVYGADPLQKTEISVTALLGGDEEGLCSHTPFDPVELADQLPHVFTSGWTAEARLGWDTFLEILRFHDPSEYFGDGEIVNFYGKSKLLGTLWAAIQTELLTYRRIEEGAPWISDNFSIRSVLKGLSEGSGTLNMPLVEDFMMSKFCKCGRFVKASDPGCVRVAEASAFYFSNLEDWKRSKFIPMPDAGY
ncbi:hypothetical protein B0O99DRAFT_523979 [Bisporella sp. PMI_857]|nr:hypothetical protein B0O99DRAFT_523979 [Bisporella sp. PMI_857]